MTPCPALSVVVLCYRSGTDLVPVVEHLHRLLSLLQPAWEIVLVGNHHPESSDATPEIVRELESRLANVRSIIRVKEGMMGWDMRSGLSESRGQHIAVIDGDGQFPLESVISCFIHAVAGGHDLVQTYRVRRDDGWTRKFISWSFNGISAILFPEFNLRDINSKPKILTRRLLDALRLEDDGWFIDAEIVLKANLMKASIGFEPIHFYQLKGRHSFVKFPALLEFARKLLAFRRRLPELKVSFHPGNLRDALPPSTS